MKALRSTFKTVLPILRPRHRPAHSVVPALVLMTVLLQAPAALAQDAANVDPVSLQSLQEGVRTFEQRREQASGARAAPSAVASERQAAGPAQPAPAVRAPRGAGAHAGSAAKPVAAAQAARRPLGAEKAAPTGSPTAGPATPGTAAARATAAGAGQIAFAGAALTPPAGIDPRIRRNAAARGAGGDTYAFLLMQELPGDDTEQALRRLGVTPLGLHGSALKVRVPLQAAVLDGIASLPGLQALAYPLPEQKIAPDLTAATARFGRDVARFPVLVDLFEADAKGLLAARLRATQAQLGRYDSALHAYEMLATPDQIKALANLDAVLFIEIERRSQGGT